MSTFDDVYKEGIENLPEVYLPDAFPDDPDFQPEYYHPKHQKELEEIEKQYHILYNTSSTGCVLFENAKNNKRIDDEPFDTYNDVSILISKYTYYDSLVALFTLKISSCHKNYVNLIGPKEAIIYELRKFKLNDLEQQLSKSNMELAKFKQELEKSKNLPELIEKEEKELQRLHELQDKLKKN